MSLKMLQLKNKILYNSFVPPSGAKIGVRKVEPADSAEEGFDSSLYLIILGRV